MPSIEIKSLDRLKPGDRLLVDAGAFAKAGRPIDKKVIDLMVKHKVVYVPTIAPTYEEKESLHKTGANESSILIQEIEKRIDSIANLRSKMIDKLKSIYIPFSEINSVFQIKGKKKQMLRDVLLEPEPGILYQPEIDAGSSKLISPNHLKFLKDCLLSYNNIIEKMTVRDMDTYGQKNLIPRQLFHSVRLHSHYGGEKLSSIGDAVPWQILDIASMFLVVMNNINKKRILQALPFSEERFDATRTVDLETLFQYRSELIVDAAMGILLSEIGYYQEKVHRVLSQRPVLGSHGFTGREQISLLQKSINISKNLFRNRGDISAISRIMITMQKEYPDGTGFPYLNENRYLHEFIRLFQIIQFYDEMTTPVLGSTMFYKTDVIKFMKTNSGPYKYSKEKIIQNAKFDASLLDEFLNIVKPWDIGEKISLYSKNSRNQRVFVGRVYSYTTSHIPLISILKDERTGKSYSYGSLLLHLPGAMIINMKGGKIVGKKKISEFSGMEIIECSINSGDIFEWSDIIFGNKRTIAKRFRKF
jgi:hypothetical protein